MPQKVAITVNITNGYKVTGLPAGEVECGQSLALKLEPVDESHWLFGKKITVTYNGQPVTVSAEEFTFGIVPVKSGTTLAVNVEDQPLD